MMHFRGKAILYALLLTLMAPAVAVSATIPGGPVFGVIPAGTHQVTGTIYVPSYQSLEIQGGATLEFAAGAQLCVKPNAELKVDPTLTVGCPSSVDFVTFQGLAGAAWDGIKVEGTITLKYSVVDGAADTGLSLLSDSSVTIDHVVFTNNSGTSGGAIYTEVDMALHAGLFQGNSAALYGGAIAASWGDLDLMDVTFDGNSAGQNGGAIDVHDSEECAIERGTFLGNSVTNPAKAAAISLYGQEAITLLNCFFSGHTTGASVVYRSNYGDMEVDFCTFNGNTGLSAISSPYAANLAVDDSIIWGNGSSFGLGPMLPAIPPNTHPVINTSDIEGLASLPAVWDTVGNGNFDADPLFSTAPDLSPASPCIGAGSGGEDIGATGGASAAGPALAATLAGGAALPALGTALDFGIIPVGSSSSKTLWVKNGGTSDLVIAAIAIVGVDPQVFSTSGVTPPYSLGHGECVELTVTFAPDVPGAFGALPDDAITLALYTADDLSTPAVAVNLSGTGATCLSAAGTLPFGSVPVGAVGSETLTVTNLTDEVLNDVTVAVDPGSADPGQFAVLDGVFGLAPGASRDLTVTFTPAGETSYNAALTITSPDCLDSLVVLVSGSGSAAGSIVIDPDPLNFAATPAGLSRLDSVVVENTTTAVLDVQLDLTDLVGGIFEFAATGTDTTSFVLPPLSARTVWISFSPVNPIFYQATVLPTVNGVPLPGALLQVDGTGTDAIFAVDPPPAGVFIDKNFGVVDVGSMSAPETWSVENAYSEPIFVEVTITDATNYVILNDEFTLAPNNGVAGSGPDFAEFQVVFAPTAAAFFDADVTISSTVDSTTYDAMLTVTGTGTAPSGFLSSSGFAGDFGTVVVGVTDTGTITVRNLKTSPVIARIDLVDDAASGTQFQLLSLSSGQLVTLFPDDLAAGGPDEVDVIVGFTPAANETNYNGSVTATVTEFGGVPITDPAPLTIPLTGFGVVGMLDVAPTSVDHGTVTPVVGSATGIFTLLNDGMSNLALISTRIIGTDAADFAVTGCPGPDGCVIPGLLVPSESCELCTEYSPSDAGTSEAKLEIRTSDPNVPVWPDASPSTVNLTGTGGTTDADIAVEPAVGDFGNIPARSNWTPGPDGAQPAIPLEITNTGVLGDLVITGLTVTGDVPVSFDTECVGGLPLSIPPNLAVGSHDGTGSFFPPRLEDSTADFTALGIAIGSDIVVNVTDGSQGTILGVNPTQIAAFLTGGTDNSWEAGDEYRVVSFAAPSTSDACSLLVADDPQGIGIKTAIVQIASTSATTPVVDVPVSLNLVLGTPILNVGDPFDGEDIIENPVNPRKPDTVVPGNNLIDPTNNFVINAAVLNVSEFTEDTVVGADYFLYAVAPNDRMYRSLLDGLPWAALNALGDPIPDPVPASRQQLIGDRPPGVPPPWSPLGYNSFLNTLTDGGGIGEYVFTWSFDNNQDGTENVDSPFREADQVTIQVSPIPMVETGGFIANPLPPPLLDFQTFSFDDPWIIPDYPIPAYQVLLNPFVRFSVAMGNYTGNVSLFAWAELSNGEFHFIPGPPTAIAGLWFEGTETQFQSFPLAADTPLPPATYAEKTQIYTTWARASGPPGIQDLQPSNVVGTHRICFGIDLTPGTPFDRTGADPESIVDCATIVTE